jgi:hypothetical protein
MMDGLENLLSAIYHAELNHLFDELIIFAIDGIVNRFFDVSWNDMER